MLGIKYVKLSKWILDRRTWVMYLIIPDIGHLGELVSIPVDDRFYEVVNKHMEAYINNQEIPPGEIAPAIMNMADDYLSGRQMTIRAGDYIAIQNYMRRGAKA
jgi:hypothetical protein